MSRTVGWFTTTHPVRLDLAAVDLDAAFAGGPAAEEALKLVKEQLREAPDHGIGYGALRYLADGDANGRLDRRPAPQISVNYLGRTAVAADGDRGTGCRSPNSATWVRRSTWPCPRPPYWTST
ncbi:hypothetical protein P9209_16625 [Prescottella defluvii]|nr:hypothetical protein P9209_16625 [Prescottella defluvii]